MLGVRCLSLSCLGFYFTSCALGFWGGDHGVSVFEVWDLRFGLFGIVTKCDWPNAIGEM